MKFEVRESGPSGRGTVLVSTHRTARAAVCAANKRIDDLGGVSALVAILAPSFKFNGSRELYSYGRFKETFKVKP
jgi:hypothetical protein